MILGRLKLAPLRRQGLRARVVPHGWGWLVPLAFAAAGILFATSAEVSRGTDLRSSGSTDLTDLIRAQEHRLEVTTKQVDGLNRKVEALTGPAAAGNSQVKTLTKKANALALAAGTSNVVGPGLTVTLDDAHLPSIPPGFTADDVVVHQQDVQAVVNALWAGGAEAMMLQDQRVISTSAVRCVGNTLILQGRVYSPPYTIKAIGDQDAMRVALQASPEVSIYQQYVEALGLGYDVKGKTKMDFPAYAGSLALDHVVDVGAGQAGDEGGKG